jgi:hypothetical protein
MNNEFKERLSNTLAWLGFGYPTLLLVGVYFSRAMNVDALYNILSFTGWSSHRWGEDVVIALIVYGACCSINYLVVGNPRLIPFRVQMKKQGKDCMIKVTVVLAGVLIFGFVMIASRQIINSLFS